MNNKDMITILNCEFGNYLKMKLEDKDLSIKKLSEITGIKRSILYKITAKDSRKTSFQEFIVIMSAINEDIDDFLDYALKRPKSVKAARVLLQRLTKEELSILLKMLVHADRHDREFLFHMIEEYNRCILNGKNTETNNK